MPGDMRRDAGGPAREAAQMQMLRHAGAVIYRIIVPEHGLAPHLRGDAGEVAGTEFPGADLRSGPEELDGGIEQPAELLQVERRALAEGGVEDRIVGIIRRTGE